MSVAYGLKLAAIVACSFALVVALRASGKAEERGQEGFSALGFFLALLNLGCLITNAIQLGGMK